MIDKKRIATERLFDTLGELDDSLLASALEYKPRAKILRARPFISAASAVAAVLVFAILIFPRMMPQKDLAHEDILKIDYSNLTVTLAKVDYDSVITLSSTDEVDLFDNQPKVIWKYTDSELCYVVNISESDLKHLSDYSPIQSVPDEICRIWLTAGDGLVTSPCLKQSAGNIGYGEIFDYSPEVEVSEAFATTLERLIT